MITVYGRRNSSSVQLVMWAIGELGLAFERLDYGHGHSSTRSADYLAMNPMGRIPVLVDGPVVMFESAAIVRYLGAAYASETFWPRDPARRGALDAWAEWGKNSFSETVLEIFAYDVRVPPDTRDPAILERAVSKLDSLARLLEDRIGAGPWIAGEDFTFADVVCGHTLYRYFNLDWTRPDLPGLAAYYERLQSRQAYRDHAMVSYEDLRGSY